MAITQGPCAIIVRAGKFLSGDGLQRGPVGVGRPSNCLKNDTILMLRPEHVRDMSGGIDRVIT